jgi:predicted XRE-type DNA-binding protein
MTQTNQNIFEDLGFSAEESENLRVRSDLMISLRKLIRSNQWSVEEAALHLNTMIDCVEGLLAGDIDSRSETRCERFQVEPLITMLTHAGMKVRVEIVAV